MPNLDEVGQRQPPVFQPLCQILEAFEKIVAGILHKPGRVEILHD